MEMAPVRATPRGFSCPDGANVGITIGTVISDKSVVSLGSTVFP